MGDITHIHALKYYERKLIRHSVCRFCLKRGVWLWFRKHKFDNHGYTLCCGRVLRSSALIPLPRGRAATAKRERNKENARILWRSLKYRPTVFLNQYFSNHIQG